MKWGSGERIGIRKVESTEERRTVQKRNRKPALETRGTREKKKASEGFLSSLACLFTSVNLDFFFCKKAILEYWICLEASRYQLK